jgi:sulfopyruvate decarboxylase TPP-binding subunit
MRETLLRPATILNEFKKNQVTHLVWLPDSETSFMFRLLVEDGAMDLVPVCREGESIAVAAGLWVGGKVPVVLIQCTGLFESGDSIRGLALDINLPLVMVIGYRGWTRHGVTPDSAARFTEPILHTWGIPYYLVESDEDAERISIAFDHAQREQHPVAVLIGSEYAEI